MTTVYKLTDSTCYTYGPTLWTPGETKTVEWGGELCRKGCLHAYSDPLLAVLFNPIHSAFKNPILWVAEANVMLDDGTKLGCDSMCLLKKHPLPEMPIRNQLIRWTILCAKEVCNERHWLNWANNWLSGEDRSHAAAYAAAYAAACYSAAYTACAVAYASALVYAAAYAAAEAAAHIIHKSNPTIDCLGLLKQAIAEEEE